jgi:hypothetical protein
MDNVLSMARGNPKLPILHGLIFVDEVPPAFPDGGMSLRKVDAVAVVTDGVPRLFGRSRNTPATIRPVRMAG